MKELVEEIMNHCDGIIERSERMTSGNYMHNCAANKFSAKIIKSCVNNLTNGGIQWQTGEPKHDGLYIVTTFNFAQKINICRILERVGYKWMNGNLEVRECHIKAWCKLSDIAPYKEENI